MSFVFISALNALNNIHFKPSALVNGFNQGQEILTFIQGVDSKYLVSCC